MIKIADVKWIKVYTDMVSNKKIKRIRKMPEGNSIVLIWVFLLAQAGESNKSGALFLTDTLPFRPEDLAIEFDFEVSVINLALITLEKFSMIEVFEDIIYIKNWNEYQNVDGLEKIREQTRVRVERCRDKQKLLTCNATSNATVTHGNAIELDKELELDIDKESKDIIGAKPQTTKFIPPTIEQVQEYCKERNNTVDAEKFVNHYAASNWFRGKTKIKNWKACVITWEKNDNSKPTTITQPKKISFMDLV